MIHLKNQAFFSLQNEKKNQMFAAVVISALTFTTLWANLADNKLITVYFFLIFIRKQYLTFHANCPHKL